MNSRQLFSIDRLRNPYPFYRELRETAEPLSVFHREGAYQREFLLFSRYRDAATIFSRGNALSKEIRAVRPVGTDSPFDLHMLHRDEPDHLRLRRLVAGHFSPASLAKLESGIADIADILLDSLSGHREADLIADYAEPLPLHVLALLMGLPLEDMGHIRRWSLTMTKAFDSFVVAEQDPAGLRETLDAFLQYAGELIDGERVVARNGLIQPLLEAGEKGQVSREELLGMMVFLLFAGHETTVNLIGNSIWLLLSHPRQRTLLQERPDLAPGAVEESLRFESPEQRTSFRIATDVIDLDGYRLEPGQQFGVIIGAANRDATAFVEPDRFDITRSPNRHFAFGAGMHNCLGKHLARLEARVALMRLLDRYPRLELAHDQPDWRHNSFFRGLARLPVYLPGH